jgi:hypothetical protein
MAIPWGSSLSPRTLGQKLRGEHTDQSTKQSTRYATTDKYADPRTSGGTSSFFLWSEHPLKVHKDRSNTLADRHRGLC